MMNIEADGTAATDGSSTARESQRQLGRQVRQLRERARLSQAAAARRAGLEQSVWSRIETGQRDPRLSELLRMQALLGAYSLEQLLGPAPSQTLRPRAADVETEG